MRLARHTLAVVLALGCAIGALGAADPDPLPYRLSVSVEWGQPRGPESFRQQLQSRLVHEIAAAGCFRTVDEEPPAEPGTEDLRLRLFIDGFEEETDFETGLADRHDPYANTKGRVVARLRAGFEAQVQAPAEELLVRNSRFRQTGSWRPVHNEDPRERARVQLIGSASRATRKFVCKGSAAAWAKELEQARRDTKR